MNALTADRIRTGATQLLLPNLAENAETLASRAEGEEMGYLEFLDSVLEEVALSA